MNANVKLTVYNVLGKRIETLVNGYLTANRYEISWDASPFPGGVYFYRLETEGFTSTKNMILVK
ncbi:MAG: T9SS type A sorting domain-containing protein [Ignavibacteria bacterium]|nr:T9SS type A sorting domain-containing protein [Ignavibacteria bacterium]